MRLTSSSSATCCSGSASGIGIRAGHGDCGDGIQVAAAHEDTEPPEHLLEVGVEQVVAPRDRRPQRPLPARPVDFGRGEVQAVPEPGKQCLRGQQLTRAAASSMASGRPSSRRQIAATSATLSGVRPKPRRDQRGLPDEDSRPQPTAADRLHACRRLAPPVAGRGLRLTLQVHGRARGGDHTRPGAARARRRRHQRRARAVRGCPAPAGRCDRAAAPRHRLSGPVGARAQGVGEGLHIDVGFADGGERHEVDAVAKAGVQLIGHGQRQPGLADAAGTGERHQPHRPRR